MAEYGESLTEREKEVLQLVATGITNREVAQELFISVNTVKVHLRNIYTKLGADSRTEATMIGVREGWIFVEGIEESSEGEGAEAEPPPEGTASPEPPLSWFKRAALIAALVLVVASVVVTWPRSREDNDSELLSLSNSGGSAASVPGQDTESAWQERAPMLTRRSHLGLAVVGDRVLAIGGKGTEGIGITSVVEAYDPEKDSWMQRGDKPTAVTYIEAEAIGTDVYVPGGCDIEGRPVRIVEVYDAQNDAWREVSPLPQPRCAYALTVWEERLYLFGGWDGERYVASAYVYNPVVDAWSELASMKTARGFAGAASLDDRLYVIGGYDGHRELASCAVYDPAADTWAACRPLTVERGDLGLVASRGQLYAIGGGGWSSYLGFNERYNPADDVWETFETPWAGEWCGPGVATFDSTIYAIGGYRDDYFLGLNQAYESLPFRIFVPVSHQQ